MTDEQMKNEFDYYLSLSILKNLLEKSLITKEQFIKIDLLNQKTFAPSLSRLMPTN